MRDGVRIVNTARGELVDEAALADALRSGKVAAAALDVFSEEPYSGPLLELDNVVATPHLAASTEEAQDRAGVIVAEQVAAALEGGLVSNAVNIPSVGAEELDVLGPVHPARDQARPARDGARRGPRRPDHPRVPRCAGRARHAPADGGGAERRPPGPLRHAGELRERAPDRGRARHRGGGGTPGAHARLHEPPRVSPSIATASRSTSRARRSVATTASGSQPRSAT